jgi:hypothetical protein
MVYRLLRLGAYAKVNGWIDRRRPLSDDAPDLIIEGRPGGPLV